MDSGVISLAVLSKGGKGVVVALQGGGGFQERVASMGLFVGCEVEVIGGSKGGRLLVAAGDTRIALGHGMAEKVMVAVDP